MWKKGFEYFLNALYVAILRVPIIFEPTVLTICFLRNGLKIELENNTQYCQKHMRKTIQAGHSDIITLPYCLTIIVYIHYIHVIIVQLA